jgi:exosortase
LVPLAAAAVLRYLATLNFEYFDGIALVLTVTGLVMLAGGMKALAWAWPGAAFLLFMLPLPYSVEHAVAGPLQRVATLCTTYIMQTIGLPALAEGNVIVLGAGKINIERACSGLSMLLIFFALATAMAILVRRPLLDRLVILASAPPIAILANVVRLTVTALIQEYVSPQAAASFHDSFWAGLLMMVFALALVWLELGFLALLFPETEVEEEVPLVFGQPAGGQKSGRSVRSDPTTGSAAARGVPPAGPSAVRVVGS